MMDTNTKASEQANLTLPHPQGDTKDRKETQSSEHPIANAIDVFLHKCADKAQITAENAVAPRSSTVSLDRLPEDACLHKLEVLR